MLLFHKLESSIKSKQQIDVYTVIRKENELECRGWVDNYSTTTVIYYDVYKDGVNVLVIYPTNIQILKKGNQDDLDKLRELLENER